MSVPCHEGPPATKGHFSSEPAVAGRGRYYCSGYSTEIVNEQCNTGDPLETSGGFYRHMGPGPSIYFSAVPSDSYSVGSLPCTWSQGDRSVAIRGGLLPL